MTSANYEPRFGRVSSVFVDDEKDEIFVNVVTALNQEPRRMKFSTPQTGLWMVPREGDLLEVHRVSGTFMARYPMKPPDSFSIPALEPGDVCLKMNAETELHFSNQPDGTVDVNLVSDGDVNLTVSQGNVNLTAEQGDISANAPSGTIEATAPSVKLGDGSGTYKPVAREGDPISGTGKDGASVTGQIDTGSPNVDST